MTAAGPEPDLPAAAVPDRASDDSDVGWGDQPTSDDDDVRRLLDERPPHHEDYD